MMNEVREQLEKYYNVILDSMHSQQVEVSALELMGKVLQNLSGLSSDIDGLETPFDDEVCDNRSGVQSASKQAINAEQEIENAILTWIGGHLLSPWSESLLRARDCGIPHEDWDIQGWISKGIEVGYAKEGYGSIEETGKIIKQMFEIWNKVNPGNEHALFFLSKVKSVGHNKLLKETMVMECLMGYIPNLQQDASTEMLIKLIEQYTEMKPLIENGNGIDKHSNLKEVAWLLEVLVGKTEREWCDPIVEQYFKNVNIESYTLTLKRIIEEEAVKLLKGKRLKNEISIFPLITTLLKYGLLKKEASNKKEFSLEVLKGIIDKITKFTRGMHERENEQFLRNGINKCEERWLLEQCTMNKLLPSGVKNRM